MGLVGTQGAFVGSIDKLSDDNVNIENCSTVVDYALNEHKYETNIKRKVSIRNS